MNDSDNSHWKGRYKRSAGNTALITQVTTTALVTLYQ